MNYSLNGETLVCLMALVMVTRGVWQPACTHKQKQHDLGQDGASSGGYAMCFMIKVRYGFVHSLCKLYVWYFQWLLAHRHQCFASASISLFEVKNKTKKQHN